MWYVHMSDRALFSPRVRLVICVPCVYILKEYENLHVYFEDYVGRRLTNASGAFLEVASSSGSSIDAFHFKIQQYLYLRLCFFSCTPSLRLKYRILLD